MVKLAGPAASDVEYGKRSLSPMAPAVVERAVLLAYRLLLAPLIRSSVLVRPMFPPASLLDAELFSDALVPASLSAELATFTGGELAWVEVTSDALAPLA